MRKLFTPGCMRSQWLEVLSCQEVIELPKSVVSVPVLMQETLDKIEKATEDAFRSEGLQESLRLIVAFGNRLNLSSSLPEGTKPNPLQLMRFRKRMVQVFDLDCLERVLGTRVYLDEGAKMSHFLVALCALLLCCKWPLYMNCCCVWSQLPSAVLVTL